MEPGSETRALLLPASVAAEQSAVAVELKFQSSGSATFALVGGHLTPGGDVLVVTIRHPLGVPPNAPDLLQVVAGLEELPDRPAGRLELS